MEVVGKSSGCFNFRDFLIYLLQRDLCMVVYCKVFARFLEVCLRVYRFGVLRLEEWRIGVVITNARMA